MSAEENKALVRRFTDAVFNRGNIDRVDAFIAPDNVEHNPMPEQPQGSEGVKWIARALRTAFPDLRFEIHDQVAEGDRVMDRWTISGTHAGDLFGLPPTGKRMAVSGFDMVRIADGKVAEHWMAMDQLGLMQQLGMLPAPGESA
jgi:steroid delta-isomerase-like uncharacterized protein